MKLRKRREKHKKREQQKKKRISRKGFLICFLFNFRLFGPSKINRFFFVISFVFSFSLSLSSLGTKKRNEKECPLPLLHHYTPPPPPPPPPPPRPHISRSPRPRTKRPDRFLQFFGRTKLDRECQLVDRRPLRQRLGRSPLQFRGIFCPHPHPPKEELGGDSPFFSLSINTVDTDYIDIQSQNGGDSIPPFYVGHEALETIALPGNGFSGALPSMIGSVPTLRTLSLTQNFFTGSIPLDMLTGSLSSLSLSENFLNGTLPHEVCDLTAMEVFQLGTNFFSGTLPGDCFAEMKDLMEFSVYFNSFSGSIPLDFCKTSTSRIFMAL